MTRRWQKYVRADTRVITHTHSVAGRVSEELAIGAANRLSPNKSQTQLPRPSYWRLDYPTQAAWLLLLTAGQSQRHELTCSEKWILALTGFQENRFLSLSFPLPLSLSASHYCQSWPSFFINVSGRAKGGRQQGRVAQKGDFCCIKTQGEFERWHKA